MKVYDKTRTIKTEAQKQWFIDNYPDRFNHDIAAELGVSTRTVMRWAFIFGLKKSDEFMLRFRLNNLLHYAGNPRTAVSRLTPEQEAERRAKISASIRRTLKKERARVTFGLPQKTKINVCPMCQAKKNFRWQMRRYGYTIDEDKRIMYYDENTHRSKRLERKNQHWYKIRPINAAG